MNKNKLIAIAVIAVTFCGPFYQLFIRENGNIIVHSAREIFLFLGWILGMIVAFYIGVNEPFGRAKRVAAERKQQAQQRKAA